ncbi:MAG: hypothetical protein WB558_02965 [Terriglobales bacterium]
MSVVVRLMVGGWIATRPMTGFRTLNESGRLLKVRERMTATTGCRAYCGCPRDRRTPVNAGLRTLAEKPTKSVLLGFK